MTIKMRSYWVENCRAGSDPQTTLSNTKDSKLVELANLIPRDRKQTRSGHRWICWRGQCLNANRWDETSTEHLSMGRFQNCSKLHQQWQVHRMKFQFFLGVPNASEKPRVHAWNPKQGKSRCNGKSPFSCRYTWGVPEIKVPLNHLSIFSRILTFQPSILGTPVYRNPHIGNDDDLPLKNVIFHR